MAFWNKKQSDDAAQQAAAAEATEAAERQMKEMAAEKLRMAAYTAEIEIAAAACDVMRIDDMSATVRQYLAGPMQKQLCARLDDYVAAASDAGVFAARWPHVLENLAGINERLRYQSAQYIAHGSAAANAVFQKNPATLVAAHKAGLALFVAHNLAPLRLPDQQVDAMKKIYGYNEAAQEQGLLSALNHYAAVILADGTFQPAWGDMLDKVAAVDAELAAQASRRLYYPGSAATLTRGPDIGYACYQTLQLSEALSLRGHFAVAAEAAADVVLIGQIGKFGGDFQRFAQENLANIQAAWRASALDRADDARTPEQKKVAAAVYQDFVNRRLAPAAPQA